MFTVEPVVILGPKIIGTTGDCKAQVPLFSVYFLHTEKKKCNNW